MLVILSGIVMLVSSEQPENALLPMLVTLLGIVTFSNVSLHITIWLVTFLEPSAIFNSFILQFSKAYLSMLVTLSGIVILVSPVQFLKTYSSMLVMLSGIFILVSPVQPENAR